MKNNTLNHLFHFITLSLAVLAIVIGIENSNAQTGETYTRVKLSYEVDGFDVWELPEPQTDAQTAAALEVFETKCANDVPAFYHNRILSLGLSLEDFVIGTSQSKFYYRGYGDSYRCRLNAEIKKRDSYSFKTTETAQYYDLQDSPAFDQCKKFRDDLDVRAEEINLFDRIIKLVWGKRNGKPVIESCYVTYTNIIQY